MRWAQAKMGGMSGWPMPTEPLFNRGGLDSCRQSQSRRFAWEFGHIALPVRISGFVQTCRRVK